MLSYNQKFLPLPGLDSEISSNQQFKEVLVISHEQPLAWGRVSLHKALSLDRHILCQTLRMSILAITTYLAKLKKMALVRAQENKLLQDCKITPTFEKCTGLQRIFILLYIRKI